MGSGPRIASKVFTNSFAVKEKEMASPLKPNNYFGFQNEENLKEILKNAWLDLYIYIKNDPQTNERNITHKLLLSFLAYKGVSLDPLLFLQQVSINSFHFCLIEPPVITEYATKVGYEFDENYIRDLLNSCFLSNASAKRQFGLCATSYASVKASKI